MKRISPDNRNLLYCGRIDWEDTLKPVFVFPCTSVSMRFTGNELKVRVENRNAYWNNYIGCIIDGKQSSISIPCEGETTLEIAIEPVQNQIHEILLFKRQDCCHELTFLGFEIGDHELILNRPAKPARKIEVYGDSVSAGEVSEAVEYIGMEDPEHNGEYSNGWYSFAWMTARKLHAQIHDIAQGGIALMDKTGWFYEPDAIGMETVWNKVHYNPQLGESTQWDFADYLPQAVIVAIGQNDSHPQDYMKEDYNGEQSVNWRRHYKSFLEKLRGQYPKAEIVCCTTLLYHDKSWDNAIKQVVTELKDHKITQFLFARNGEGTPGHLRIPEAEEMAAELAAYIENLNVEGWK